MVRSVLRAYTCVNVCVVPWLCVWNDGRDGGGEIAAGTGPKRQRNHLDELPHTLPRFSVPATRVQWRSQEREEKERERGEKVREAGVT